MNIYITLDYELFSSYTPGTPEKCIIEPMDALSELAKKYNVRYTIFVDAAYLLTLYSLKCKNSQIERDFILLENNIKKLVAEGHDIQLHFHPQWIYTDWDHNNKKWIMDTAHFKLSDMEPNVARESFASAKVLLDNIVGHKTNCFRACGYCLDTYTEYIELFKKNGIEKDSSVVRYCYAQTKAHSYDYRLIPQEHVYCFKDSVKEKNDDGSFKELSIATYLMPPILHRMKMRSYESGKVYKDGSALQAEKLDTFAKVLYYLKPNRILASIDGGNSMLLSYYLDKAIKFHWNDLVMCGHPKNATEGSIRNLERFLEANISKYTFLTSKDI